jgi:uncharacterized membrane-anchored protein YhcB (DUF1043 family)
MITFDGSTSIWLTGILFTALGAMAGSIITYLVVARHGRTRKLQNELDQLKDRFTDYRDQVTQHFMRTSELVQEMTQSYRAVYEHLASGAQNLCGGQIEAPHRSSDEREALGAEDSVEALAGSAPDYDDLAGDMPRISDLDIKADAGSRQPLKH